MPKSTRSSGFPDIKVVRPKRGKTYYYFKTGQINPQGKPIYAKLPDMKATGFWDAVAAFRGAKTKRQVVEGELTLRGMISLYQKSEKWRKLAEKTRNIYSIYLATLADAFGGDAPASEIERKDMMALVDGMADRPGAANMQLRTASALYAWARRRGHVTARPCDDIDIFEMGEHEPWPQELLDAALATDDAFVKLAVHLLYYTGQRIGDVSMMQWGNVKDGRVQIVQEKTGAVVSFSQHPELAALLTATAKTGITVLAHDGKAYRRATIRDKLQAWAEKRGHEVVPHGLRKNAVNALLECGCSTAEAAAITRQSLQMVEHYAKARDTAKLGDAAILKWSDKRGTGKH